MKMYIIVSRLGSPATWVGGSQQHRLRTDHALLDWQAATPATQSAEPTCHCCPFVRAVIKRSAEQVQQDCGVLPSVKAESNFMQPACKAQTVV